MHLLINKILMSLSGSDVVYVAPTQGHPVVRPPPQTRWHSCCFTMDKSFVMYIVQTVIGIGLLLFCSYRLSTEPDCDKASPYWGLIGTVCGFFFNQVANSEKRPVIVQSV